VDPHHTGHEGPSPGCITLRTGPPHRYDRLVHRATTIGSSAIMMGSMLRVPEQGSGIILRFHGLPSAHARPLIIRRGTRSGVDPRSGVDQGKASMVAGEVRRSQDHLAEPSVGQLAALAVLHHRFLVVEDEIHGLVAPRADGWWMRVSSRSVMVESRRCSGPGSQGSRSAPSPSGRSPTGSAARRSSPSAFAPSNGMTQAAGFSLMPSVNLVPRTTSASSGDPFNDRQPFEALSISLNTIVRHAVRVPLPLVLS
jgi:hypothetical protein